MFEEGLYYPFKILKTVVLPDEKEYFVLQAPDEKKHLMLKTYYKDYSNIKEGETVDFKIDRINCNGKLFLEPKHPYLKEGAAYKFTVVEVEEIYTNMVDKEQTLIVYDNLNNKFYACAD
ncbi:MAG: hypothetical protein ABIJ97_09930, partial [Bacteroidota bacterium]